MPLRTRLTIGFLQNDLWDLLTLVFRLTQFEYLIWIDSSGLLCLSLILLLQHLVLALLARVRGETGESAVIVASDIELLDLLGELGTA